MGKTGQAEVSRRDFLRGTGRLAAVVGALSLGAGSLSLSACGRSSDDSDVQVLDVSANSVVTLDAFASMRHPTRHYRAETIATLDAGSELFAAGGKVAAVLSTGKTAKPLSTVGLMGLSSGTLRQVLARAQGQDDGFDVYAVRCSDELLVWVESNYLTGDWRVYSAALDADALSIESPVLLDSGDTSYDVPEIACIGQTAYWIVQPDQNGERTREDSQLKAASGGAASVLHASHGRFNGGLSVSGQVLTAMPRADASGGVYYQLTAFQSGSGAIVATQTMPRSFRPVCATYVNNAFSFAIGASYDYGGGIANVGTYCPLSGGEWLRIAKTPVTPMGSCDGWLFCKSGSRTVFIDTAKRRYFTADAPDGASDYGDYSAGTGEVDAVCNYATVTQTKGSKQSKSVVVRKIVPTASA